MRNTFQRWVDDAASFEHRFFAGHSLDGSEVRCNGPAQMKRASHWFDIGEVAYAFPGDDPWHEKRVRTRVTSVTPSNGFQMIRVECDDQIFPSYNLLSEEQYASEQALKGLGVE